MNNSFKFVLAIIVLILTIVAAVILYIWTANQYWVGWFEQWLVIAAITFLLGIGITLSALLIERGIKDRHDMD
ncbi:MAG: hypothetical protein FWE31_00015 [Firmicutes bacterium]|nr:hypothetical protein [Bacillota bacterium]